MLEKGLPSSSIAQALISLLTEASKSLISLCNNSNYECIDIVGFFSIHYNFPNFLEELVDSTSWASDIKQFGATSPITLALFLLTSMLPDLPGRKN